MFLESETNLTLVLGIAAAVGLVLTVLLFIAWTRTAAALHNARQAVTSTSTGADRTEQRMFTILQAIPVALVETDTSGKFTFANRTAHQLLGRKDSELLGLRFHSATWGITYPDGRLIPPDLLPAARALRGQTVKGFQHMMVNPNTRRKMLVSVTAMPIMNDVGEVIGSSSAIVESESLTTPQVDPEELMKSRYYEVAGAMLLAIDRKGMVKDVNSAGARILGAKVEDVVGKDWIKDFLPLEDQKEARAFFESVIAGDKTLAEDGEGWIVRPDGEKRLMSWRGAVLYDERDRISGILTSGIDMTDVRATQEALREKETEAEKAKAEAEALESRRGEIEKALQESEARFATISEALSDAIWLYDPAEKRVLHVNAAYDAMWGESRDVLLADSTRWRELVHPDDVPLIVSANAALARGEPREIEFRIRRASDGEERIVRDSAFVVRGEDGETRRIAGVARDVTDERKAHAALAEVRETLDRKVAESERELQSLEARRREAAEALERAQRFETVGRLTGGVAHDFNSLMTVVTGALDMISHQADQPERVKRLSAAALAAMQRGQRLTRQLMSFSQGETFKLETLELEPVVLGLEPMLRRALDDKPVDFEVQHDLGSATFDAAQLEAALVNLVRNAKEAVKDGGTIAVRADQVRLGDGQIADTPAGEYARLSVIDTGVGMSADIAARAFEPFFTTRDDGESTGLGLAQVYAFARQSGGGVGIDSAPGAGSTVSIYLPVKETPVAHAAETAATAASA
ncbi:MAG TPA: PAS domain S-box protein [Caulobacteraceae bacterium]|jgi:PAS domain S-box-containing protein|nr:PAS domain S-box protein [Caulobacteraceae bacterium]